MHQFLKFIFGIKLRMFRTVPLSIIGSFSLYTQQWCMSYRFADGLQTVSKPVLHIPLLCVQWKTADDGQRNCPKHAEFYSKNKFEKLVHLVGFIIRIYHDARSPERQNLYVAVSWMCTFRTMGVYTVVVSVKYNCMHILVSLKLCHFSIQNK